MSRKLQPVTKAPRDAAIYAALATGANTHEEIAAKLGCSRVHVSRVAAAHRAAIDAEAAKTKQAAIDGPARARQMAADATPHAMTRAIAVMNEEVSPEMASHVLAAAKTVMDRGGVPVRTAIDATINADPERLARLAAMLRSA